jgi:hypothetical protein
VDYFLNGLALVVAEQFAVEEAGPVDRLVIAVKAPKKLKPSVSQSIASRTLPQC